MGVKHHRILAPQGPDEARQMRQIPGSHEGRHLAQLDAEVTGTRNEARQSRIAVVQEQRTPSGAVQSSQELKHDALGSAEVVAVGVVNDGFPHRVTPRRR